MRATTLSDDTLAKLASDVLTRPDSFATSDDNIATTHGLMFGVHRDSGNLERSNWEVISTDLLTRYADQDSNNDVYIFSASHWAVGWVDQLAVRVYRYPHPLMRVYTDAFLAAAKWAANLEAYPVADESHYSETEHEDAIETLTNCYDIPRERTGDVFGYLFDSYSYCSGADYRNDAVSEAIAYLHLDCQRCGDHRAVMLETVTLAYGGTQQNAVCIACVIAFPELPHSTSAKFA